MHWRNLLRYFIYCLKFIYADRRSKEALKALSLWHYGHQTVTVCSYMYLPFVVLYPYHTFEGSHQLFPVMSAEVISILLRYEYGIIHIIINNITESLDNNVWVLFVPYHMWTIEAVKLDKWPPGGSTVGVIWVVVGVSIDMVVYIG